MYPLLSVISSLGYESLLFLKTQTLKLFFRVLFSSDTLSSVGCSLTKLDRICKRTTNRTPTLDCRLDCMSVNDFYRTGPKTSIGQLGFTCCINNGMIKEGRRHNHEHFPPDPTKRQGRHSRDSVVDQQQRYFNATTPYFPSR